MTATLDLLLLDVDGVLLDYQRAQRVRHLADAVHRPAAQVQRVLFDEGLETAYDSGTINTDDYLHALSRGLQAEVDASLWTAARVAASRPRGDVVQRVLALPSTLRLGLLTNNGPLMAEVVAQRLPTLATRLGDNVLCSGALGGRKPDPAVFLRALQRLHAEPARTLFVDDLFVNVRGARLAGLQADTVRDSRSLGRVLKRHGLG